MVFYLKLISDIAQSSESLHFRSSPTYHPFNLLLCFVGPDLKNQLFSPQNFHSLQMTLPSRIYIDQKEVS